MKQNSPINHLCVRCSELRLVCFFFLTYTDIIFSQNVYDDSSRIHAAPSPKTPRSGMEPKDLLRLSSSPPLTSHHTLSPSPGATGVLMAAANDPVTSRHYDEVLHYIREKDREGRKLNTVEVEGLIALLRKASDGSVWWIC